MVHKEKHIWVIKFKKLRNFLFQYHQNALEIIKKNYQLLLKIKAISKWRKNLTFKKNRNPEK